MAFNSFLKIEGIEGESTDKTHPGEIEISSFSWGETNTGTASPGGGGGAGKVQMQDFHFTMATSKASPKLMSACATGKHFPTVIVTSRRGGGGGFEFLKYKLDDCMVTSYSIGADGGSDTPEDSLSIVFAKIEFAFTVQRTGEIVQAAIDQGGKEG